MLLLNERKRVIKMAMGDNVVEVGGVKFTMPENFEKMKN